MSSSNISVGIDDISAYIPKLMLPIQTLAEARGLEYVKLNKGLGLEAMAVADAHEDMATMAANAVLNLLLKNSISPNQVGRIYVGTESAVDGAKPMATYVLDMLTQYFREEYGDDCLLNCDVVDLTFACIGAVDAMQNTLDWARGNSDRIGIVVGSDIAKYELDSGGEYTQGAGAVAVMIRQQPRLLEIPDTWGVATRSVHDFFKPLHTFSKKEIIKEVLELIPQNDININELLEKLNDNIAQKGVLDSQDEEISIHRDTPVFDGPYSNLCYRNRIWEALQNFAYHNGDKESKTITDDWYRMIFHLPYAFQARRMFAEVFMIESQQRGDWASLEEELNMDRPSPGQFNTNEEYEKAYSAYLRAITKTARYKRFINEKIEKGERASSLVGNLYTSSILLSLMSTLEAALEEDRDISGTTFGFFAYGSGSKSKVFTGIVQEGWKSIVGRFGLFQSLASRTPIDYPTYEQLHRKRSSESVANPSGVFSLVSVCDEPGVQKGARTYRWMPQHAFEKNTRTVS
jgi:hydroxymethylglutaryl-CoA synthase